MIPFSATQNTRSPLFTDLQARPADTPASAISSGSNSTISSNDFLTLLVTEMKNQDPTSATDPNQYVNQLVSVNSLEQLIEINQTRGHRHNRGARIARHFDRSRLRPAGGRLRQSQPAARESGRAANRTGSFAASARLICIAIADGRKLESDTTHEEIFHAKFFHPALRP
jgi:hypothetical protein